MKIELDISDEDAAYLNVLGAGAGLTPKEVIEQLIDHATQGVYRPGAWERSWIEQAFGPVDDKNLEKHGGGIPNPKPTPRRGGGMKR